MTSLIGLDWGTSTLRAYLFGQDGGVVERRSRPWGIQHLPAGGYEAAFRDVAGDWRARNPALPVLAGGMVGSRQGWREVPYVDCPADGAAIARGVVPFDSDVGRIHLLPGLVQRGAFPDVMRGEEVQIVGAAVTEPGLASAALVVLPGTHCKWATLRSGVVTGFTTYLTGELYAMLRDHSIVGRPGREAAAGVEPGLIRDAFLRGVRVARDSGAAGIAGRLFTTRSLFLVGELPVGDTLDYLSGLVVGEELRSVLAARGAGGHPRVVVVGDPALCSRHGLALAEFGVADVRILDETAPAGLWTLAREAGLVS